MFPRALRIARVGGIDVRVDPSWLIIAILVVWTFIGRFQLDGRQTGAALAMAISAAALFFLSVLAHELGHALEAKHRDVTVTGITLFLFGGVTEMTVEAERPRDEFAIAAVGPYVSLVAAATFGLVAASAGVYGGALAAAVGEVAGVVGWINLLLAAFNLVPGAPLDGGRVFRAIVWAITEDRSRAVAIASRAGQLVAAALVAYAVWLVIEEPAALFSTIWFGLIGWFMWNAAGAELRYERVRSLLKGRAVGTLSQVAAPPIPADQPLTTVADGLAGSPGFEVFPVVEDGGDGRAEVVGALLVDDVLEMHPLDRGFRTARDVMRPIDEAPAVTAQDDLHELVQTLQQPDVAFARVIDADRVVALLTTRQIDASLRRLQALEHGGGRRRGAASHLPPPPPDSP